MRAAYWRTYHRGRNGTGPLPPVGCDERAFFARYSGLFAPMLTIYRALGTSRLLGACRASADAADVLESLDGYGLRYRAFSRLREARMLGRLVRSYLSFKTRRDARRA